MILVNQVFECLIDYQQFRISILNHKVQALLRITRIQWLISATSLQYAQRCYHHPLATRNEDGNDRRLTINDFIYLGGDAVTYFIHLLIGVSLVLEDHSDVVGRSIDLTTKKADNVLVVIVGAGGGVKAIQ